MASCNVVSEGTDIPSVSAAILPWPTASYALAMQQMGRGLRASPGKTTCVVLDHADNVRRHGLPTDEVEWSLAGLQRKKSIRGSLIKTCNSCGALVALRTAVCADCGYTFHAAAGTDSPDKGFIERDGELVEMTPEMIEQIRRRKRTELIGARTKEQLVELGRGRNYKNPGFWADKIIEGREQYKAQHGGRA